MLDAPVDVVLGAGAGREVVQPDILFIAAERVEIITRSEVTGCPDLVVEVLSPGTAEPDCHYKKTLYARYGAREYWIVDPDRASLERYMLGADGFGMQVRLTQDDTFTSPLFPDLILECREFFFAMM